MGENLPPSGCFPRFSLGCLLATTTGICVFLASCSAFLRYVEGAYVLQKFDCGSGRTVVITAARSWEMSQPVFYLVLVDGRTIVPTTAIAYAGGGDAGKMKFDIHFAANRQVVGIFDHSNQTEYLAIHDFRDNASWPRGEGEARHRGSGKFMKADLEALLRRENDATTHGT